MTNSTALLETTIRCNEGVAVNVLQGWLTTEVDGTIRGDIIAKSCIDISLIISQFRSDQPVFTGWSIYIILEILFQAHGFGSKVELSRLTLQGPFSLSKAVTVFGFI
jgi:hypothetical protein